MKVWKTACTTIGLFALTTLTLVNPVLAACATADDAAALKTAVMQQELMVAAFQCHEASAYNHFVMAYRGELQSSDAALKAYFVRRDHNEAGYDTFKTKAANLSALEQARDSRAFCADAHALFAAAARNTNTLARFVDSRAADTANVCAPARPVVVVAARPAPALVKVADARPVHEDDAALVGVPQLALPVRPWRREETARDRHADDQYTTMPSYADSDADDAPPPRPRSYQIRDRGDDEQDYRDRGYGPPPNWRDPYQAPYQDWRDAPRPRWVDRDGYYR